MSSNQLTSPNSPRISDPPSPLTLPDLSNVWKPSVHYHPPPKSDVFFFFPPGLHFVILLFLKKKNSQKPFRMIKPCPIMLPPQLPDYIEISATPPCLVCFFFPPTHFCAPGQGQGGEGGGFPNQKTKIGLVGLIGFYGLRKSEKNQKKILSYS